jgi:hypothetical protein
VYPNASDSTWTRIPRKVVNPEALESGKEKFTCRNDYIYIYRVLTKDEVQHYADITAMIRQRRIADDEGKSFPLTERIRDDRGEMDPHLLLSHADLKSVEQPKSYPESSSRSPKSSYRRKVSDTDHTNEVRNTSGKPRNRTLQTVAQAAILALGAYKAYHIADKKGEPAALSKDKLSHFSSNPSKRNPTPRRRNISNQSSELDSDSDSSTSTSSEENEPRKSIPSVHENN